jgi:hydrogenase nickel incorporation protein HypB
MCQTCGCSGDGAVITEPGHQHEDADRHTHEHEHGHEHGHRVTLEQDVLAKNDQLAEDNRRWLRERGVLSVNLMSSPGAGKTTLLERTARDAGLPMAVIEGDQETMLDAERIKAAGAPVVQINTGAGCHLDAAMLDRAVRTVEPAPGSVLFIENVGNLVCPALFDLGEEQRVVILSVTEGQDKPRKYPHMFASADLVLLNKTDLLPYLDFDIAAFLRDARRVNPDVEVVRLSATRGTGLADWYSWLREHRPHLEQPAKQR